MLASEFDVLLERYEQDPVLCSRLLRTEALTDPKQFVSYARLAILEKPVSRSITCITAVALSAGLIEHILELYSESREQAISLAKCVLASKPLFDSQLLEFIKRPLTLPSAEAATLQIGIDILDEIATDDRLVPGVLKLLEHPSPKVRSKAALFVGARTQNFAWVASLTQEYDPRVRANIIESLYGSDSEFVPQIFRNNVGDDNCRVAGNAVLGLYLLGDVSSIAHIHQFVKHPEARFRNTGAWLMGRTRDPRFSIALSELMTDPDALVRRQALKALGEIRKNLREMTARPQLDITTVSFCYDDEQIVIATVQNNSGQFVRDISPTCFVLKTGDPGGSVRTYAVEEHKGQPSLSVCFVLCLPPGPDSALDTQFVQAIQSCNHLRRAEDNWAIAKMVFSSKQSAGSPEPSPVDAPLKDRVQDSVLDLDAAVSSTQQTHQSYRLEYSLAQDRIDDMLRCEPFSTDSIPDQDAAALATQSLLKANGASNHPHWIIVGLSEDHSFVRKLLAEDLAATVHVIARAPAWQTLESKQLAQTTGGVYRELNDMDQLQQASVQVYSSILHHYRISWAKDASRLELDIYSEAGRGSALCELTPDSSAGRPIPLTS